MVRQQFIIEMSNHPIFAFYSNPEYGSCVYTLVGRTILQGWRMDVVQLLGFNNEVELMFSITSYHRVVTINKPCFEELIIEFYTSFKFHDTDMMFQLGGAMRRLTMQEFRVVLGLWTVEHQSIDIYATAV